jgi:glutamate synthase (NADPH/NADH) small chain
MGAEVTLVYRRTEGEMPARAEELEHAKQEGIKIRELVSPVKFLGDNEGRVRKIECMRMKLGEPDESGRRKPIPIEDSRMTIDANTVVIAIGQSPNPVLIQATPELKTSEKGTIIVDENGQTSMEGVFAGGDITTGTATVIQAIGAGKRAAHAIHRYLGGL